MRAVYGKSLRLNNLGYEGDKKSSVPLVEFLGAVRGLPVRIDADTGEVEVGAEEDEEELIPDVAEPSSSSKRPRVGPPPPEPEPPEGPVVVQDEDPVPVQITEERLRIHQNHGHQPYLKIRCLILLSASCFMRWEQVVWMSYVMEIRTISSNLYSETPLGTHVSREIYALGAVPSESAPGEGHCGKAHWSCEGITLVNLARP